jgi:hypothetical protein
MSSTAFAAICSVGLRMEVKLQVRRLCRGNMDNHRSLVPYDRSKGAERIVKNILKEIDGYSMEKNAK